MNMATVTVTNTEAAMPPITAPEGRKGGRRVVEGKRSRGGRREGGERDREDDTTQHHLGLHN